MLLELLLVLDLSFLYGHNLSGWYKYLQWRQIDGQGTVIFGQSRAICLEEKHLRHLLVKKTSSKRSGFLLGVKIFLLKNSRVSGLSGLLKGSLMLSCLMYDGCLVDVYIHEYILV